MMRRSVAILAAISGSAALFFFAACGKKEGPAAAYPAKIETVDGVRTILNPDFPKEGVIRYALQDDLTIGGEGGGAESVLNRPQYLDVDAQGDIYVLDWGDVDFKVFGPDGRLIRRFGQKGQGPGEFDIPASFAFGSDGRIFLLSGRQHQMILLDRTGKYLSSFRLDGFCRSLGVDSSGRVYFSQMLTPETGGGEEFKLVQNKIALFKTDETGKEKVPLGEYLAETSMMKTQGNMVSGLTSREAYTTSWLVGPQDRLYIGYNKDYRLEARDADGKPLFRFGREFTPVRHPAYKPNGAHPEYYPAFSDWRKFFDSEGNLWLEQYVEEGVKDHVFDVFSPEGIYLRQVLLPETVHLVRGDLAYTIIRTEEDFLVVKRYKLVREEKPGS